MRRWKERKRRGLRGHENNNGGKKKGRGLKMKIGGSLKTGCKLRWRMRAKMMFHPGRKTRTAPGMPRVSMYLSSASTSSKLMSFSLMMESVCLVASE